MSRTKAFDETQALEAAMLQFWKNGYAATSMQTLEDATGLKRPSLYNAFGNKRALFEKALELYLSSVISAIFEAIDAAPTAKAAVEAALNGAIALHFEETHPGGCMVVLSVLESCQHEAATRALLNQAVAQLKDGLERRFERARAEKELPETADCTALADAIVSMVAGLLVLAKADVSKHRLDAVVGLATGLVP